MTDLTVAIERIEAAVQRVGLAEFARAAGVPYTTAIDWRAKGWRPKHIETFEKFASAANLQPADRPQGAA